MKYAALLVILLPLPALAELQMSTLRYSCERGVEVPVTYVTAGDQSVVTLTVDGRQISLYKEVAASGARYGWPSDGSNYIWLTKDPEAILYWKDENGAETPILSDCKQQ